MKAFRFTRSDSFEIPIIQSSHDIIKKRRKEYLSSSMTPYLFNRAYQKKMVASLLVIQGLFFMQKIHASETNFLKIVTLVNPEERPELFNLFDRINNEICRRIHYTCSLSFVPGARAAMLVENGTADGENYRTYDFSKEKENTHHLRVDTALYTANFFAWGRIASPKVNSWTDLVSQNKNVIYLFGSKTVVNNLTGRMGQKLMHTYSVESGLKMLMSNRATYFVTSDSSSVKNIITQLNLDKEIAQLGLVENIETYMYMNDKHRALLPKINDAILQMKKDGTLNKMLSGKGDLVVN